MQPHKRAKATVKGSLRPTRLEPAIDFGATQTDLFAPASPPDPSIPAAPGAMSQAGVSLIFIVEKIRDGRRHGIA